MALTKINAFNWKDILKHVKSLAVFILALLGAQQLLLHCQYRSMQNYAESVEAKREYDADLLYHKDGGEPLLLTTPNYRTTLFFLEGFRTQSPAGMYLDWFNELHRKSKINVVVPVYGLQSSPFKLRNRDWRYQEDIRTVLQIYDAYTSLLANGHRIVLVAQSFGALPAAAIAAKARRRPNHLVFLSPLNSGMEFRAAGELVYWFSKQTNWLRHILLFTKAEAPPNRASVWDIVNAEKNLSVAARGDVNPEDSSEYGFRVEKAAVWLEQHLLPQIRKSRITVAWGDSDLYFSQDGFQNFVAILKNSSNELQILKLKDSGHMVLLDNEEKRLKDAILEILRSTR